MINSQNLDIRSLVEKYVSLKHEADLLLDKAKQIEGQLLLYAEELLANTKYKSTTIRGTTTQITATTANTLKIVYPSELKAIFGKTYSDMIKEETTYKPKTQAARILTSVFNNEYAADVTLEELITGLPADEKQKKLLLKKLRGIDFDKDKKAFMSICGYDEDMASDYAYMVNEAVAWENLTKLQLNKTDHTSPDRQALQDTIKRIQSAVVVEQNTKITITNDGG